jgi:hypothetical protein
VSRELIERVSHPRRRVLGQQPGLNPERSHFDYTPAVALLIGAPPQLPAK